MDLLDCIRQNVIDGDLSGVQNHVDQALSSGTAPAQILNQGLIAAMAEVGRLFGCGEYYVPEMLLSAHAMKGGLQLLRPQLAAAKVRQTGKILLGTVQGDLHDIGKNLVGMMMEGSGFEVMDLGVDSSPSKFVEAVKDLKPDLVGLSALLTTTMPNMKSTIEALKQAGIRDNVKVMIGGAPVTAEYAKAIGADIYAPDAASAATLAKQAIG